MKEWIRHDVSAFLDPAILTVTHKHGVSAYGIFWALIELMARSRDLKLRFDDLEAYEHMFRAQGVRAVVDDLIGVGLFSSDDSAFWSERLLRERQYAAERQEWRTARAKKAAAARWGNENDDASSNASSKRVAHTRNATNQPTNRPTNQPTVIVGPVPLDTVRAYFKKRQVPDDEARLFYQYWSDLDWTGTDPQGQSYRIDAGNWKRRAGVWITRWRRKGSGLRAMTHSEMIKDWERRGRPDMETTYERTEDGKWNLRQ